MSCAETRPTRRAGAAGLAAAFLALAALAGCGGGNSTETTISGGGVTAPVSSGVEAVVSQPQGANTVEVVVDSGPPAGFALGATNLPYVTVTVCAPGSTTACVSVDHVFLDTGSIGFRVLRSAVAGLALPPALSGSGHLVECYPFVIGAVWGALASADLAVGGERAQGLPIQLIDDATPRADPAPADCQAAASGDLLASVTALQAKGVLGIGMLSYDCGLACETGNYAGGYTLYYRCDAGGACAAAAVPAAQQLQNPVSRFAVDNNGSVIVLPALGGLGAAVARGRLVFGIGTQTNNQPPPGAAILHVQTDPAAADYLFLGVGMGSSRYDFSYLDSGSNAYFFDDSSLSTHCTGGGAGSSWYCPATVQTRALQLQDPYGSAAAVDVSIASADLLFASANTAFANLGGASGAANPGAFVFGLPFFYGRQVYTSIWGQALSASGPWVAFQPLTP